MWEREHHMENVQKEIDESKKIIDFCHHELNERMHAVKKEARALTREMETEGIGEAEKIFESAQQEIAALKESTAKEIAIKIEKAKTALASEAETLAVTIMEKMLDRRLNP